MIRNFFNLLILLGLSTSISFAQTGKISGKVIDEKSSETLVGVSVIIKGGQQLGAVTDIEGGYTIDNLSEGTYTITVSYVGYKTKEVSDIVVKKGNVTNVDVVLPELQTLMTEVVITATRKQEAVTTVLAIQKNNVTVSDVMSGDAIRRSPDRNTSEVIRRVSGISIQDNRFPIVRGLSDRYNTALVNGVVLPSTEPDRKAFSFDIFPAALIDNIIVNKAATPEMPGDFAGGLIQLNTKDIPVENFLSAQVNIGVNTQVMGNDFYQSANRGSLDWLGISDKSRDLPEKFPSAKEFTSAPSRQQGELSKQFTNDWGIAKTTATPNIGVQLTSGFIKKLDEKQSFGGVFALTYNKSNRNFEVERAEYLQSDVLRQFNDRRYNSNILAGVLANFAFNINANNKISLKNTFNINTDDFATVRTGRQFEGTEGYVRGSLIRYRENQFFTSQLSGDHRLTEGGIKLHWILGYNKISRDLPNQRQINYFNPNGTDEAGYTALVGNSVNPNGVGKLYSYLDETTYIGNIDLAVPLHKNHNAKIGFNYQNRDRLFDARAFGVVRGDQGIALTNQKQDVIFRPENISFDKFYYGELTDATYRYDAQTSTIAPFVMFDSKLTEKLRAVYGVRYETYPIKLTSSQLVDNTFSAVLPSLNMTYSLSEKSNLRFCASQTLARPELRELAPFSFYDYEVNRTVRGNPSLTQTKITNVDLRYEWFPEGGQLFSVSAFYKRFKDPIEEIFNTTGAGTLLTDYTNAVSANSLGAELEFRKNLSFISSNKVWEDIVVFSNLAYIQTDVAFKGTGTSSEPISINRPLQGQSPYVVNVGLQYSNVDNGWGATVLFNQIGKRITFVGSADFPAIVELPRPLLDFQVSKKFKKSEIRLNVSDILNARYRFFQDWNNDLNYNSGDSFFINQRQGTNISVTFAYKL